MQRQTVLAICLLTVLAFSWSVAIARASSVNYTIHDGKVSVELSLQFYQNATAMPTLSEKFTGAAAQDLTSAIEEALKSKVNGISISSLSGELISSSDWINASIRFDVSGVASESGSVLNVNCSWITFKVPNDLRLENVSYNTIGSTYIKPAFEKYASFDKPPLNETVEDVAYQFGVEPVPTVEAAERAGNTTLLDFSYLSSRVEGWRMAYNYTRGSTRWVYERIPVAEMLMIVTPRGENPFIVAASYAYNATLSVDGLAQAHGEIITTEVSGGYEPLLMLAVVIATFIVAVTTGWIYRSRRKQLPRRRK
jgi:hypothetical protein